VSLSQLNVHLTIKETVHGQLCFLFCTYILTAQCPRMQRYYKQQDLVIITSKGSTFQQPRKSRLVVAVASVHKSSQGLHMQGQGVGQK
jgi:hypothetical protein